MKEKGGGRDGGRGEAEREEGVRQGATSGRQFWALVAVRSGGRWACRLHCSHRPSSPFVVVAGGPRSSLASGGGHFRSSVVAIVCVCGCLCHS